ncbi:hypothetical protein AAFF_G00192680 [Aldrovandia affinis]|uniref:CCHC-type domain-containing protein n=1 Tax=Aldrovandia affinis TaxID=143900 RepID=A0AAD7RJA1_9TELE|nr:hypothetical protein AAFF_G00192680 [Aldrovandia affinis]
MSMETAAKDVAELQQAGVERAVHKVQSGAAPAVVCFRCGGNHVAADCRFVDAVCHNCHKRGRLARKCRSARQPRRDRGNAQGATHMLEGDVNEEEYTNRLCNLEDGERVEPYRERMLVNGHAIDFEIDTGAGLTIINEKTYRKMGGGPLHRTNIKLYTYTRDRVGVLGKMIAQVGYKGQTKQLAALVVKGEGPN